MGQYAYGEQNVRLVRWRIALRSIADLRLLPVRGRKPCGLQMLPIERVPLLRFARILL